MKRTLSSLLMLLFTMQGFGQNKCGTDQILMDAINSDPAYYNGVIEANEKWNSFKQTKNSSTQNRVSNIGDIDTLISIPIVYHVLWNTAAQNISDARLKAQIDKLNEDFNRYNTDASNTRAVFQSRAGRAKINFFLANVDPEGNPTTGINRIQTTKISWLQGYYMKLDVQGGADPWPNARYCNVWVCNLNDGGILAYATFPQSFINFADGIVTGYQWVGGPSAAPISSSYSGRTMVHEMGHWLGLPHIWGPGPLGTGNGLADAGSCLDDDGVDDTPFSNSQYWGCPTGNPNTCTEPTGTDLPDNFENYMDYVDDNCMNMFTKGQNQRMYYSLMELRKDLGYTSAKLLFVNQDSNPCESFDGSSSLPTVWHTGNSDGKKDWTVDSTNGYVYFDNTTAPTVVSSDNIYTPGFSNLGELNVTITMKWAYALRTGFPSDTMRVWASYDNGMTWRLLDEKFGSTLATASPTATKFVPTSSDWNSATYTANWANSNVTGSRSVQFRVENFSAKGNALYLDEFCASTVVGIAENTPTIDVVLQPNPASDRITLTSNGSVLKDCSIQVVDVHGKAVLSEVTPNGSLNVSSLSAGIYFAKAYSNDYTTKYIKFVKE